jgi:hypothetical protein
LSKGFTECKALLEMQNSKKQEEGTLGFVLRNNLKWKVPPWTPTSLTLVT